MGEHLPCKQGVKSSNLSVSIVDVIKLLQSALYLENFIQNDKMIKYLFDQDIVITVKFFNNSSTLEKYYSSYQRYDNED